MKKKILKAVLGILICWGIFVAIEGFRLIVYRMLQAIH